MGVSTSRPPEWYGGFGRSDHKHCRAHGGVRLSENQGAQTSDSGCRAEAGQQRVDIIVEGWVCTLFRMQLYLNWTGLMRMGLIEKGMGGQNMTLSPILARLTKEGGWENVLGNSEFPISWQGGSYFPHPSEVHSKSWRTVNSSQPLTDVL